jgi:hypothetical protein
MATHDFANVAVLKSEIRITKSETNPKIKTRMFETAKCRSSGTTVETNRSRFQDLNLGYLDLFGTWVFDIGIFLTAAPSSRSAV